jgi:hypothetical protein
VARGEQVAEVLAHAPSPVGTAFSFQLNEPAHVSFTFTRHLAGRRVHGRCMTGTNAKRTKPICDRSVPDGVLQFGAHAGTNKLLFQGRIRRLQNLAPGRYTVRINASNSAGQRSNVVSLAFTITLSDASGPAHRWRWSCTSSGYRRW